MLDLLEGRREMNPKWHTGQPTISEHVLYRLDKILVNKERNEVVLERECEEAISILVDQGRGDSQYAEFLRVMIEVLRFYRSGGVFDGGEYSPRKVENWKRWDGNSAPH
jgi:hypothetical protein